MISKISQSALKFRSLEALCEWQYQGFWLNYVDPWRPVECWLVGRGPRTASTQPVAHGHTVPCTLTHAHTILEGQTDHTLSLHHAAPQANVPALLVQLLYIGTLAYATQWLVAAAVGQMFHRIIIIYCCHFIMGGHLQYAVYFYVIIQADTTCRILGQNFILWSKEINITLVGFNGSLWT